MIGDWILRENLKAFCEVCAFVVGYNYTELDWDAISYGVDSHQTDDGQWFEYAFEGSSTISFRLAFETQGGQHGIVMVEIDAILEIEQQICMAVMIMQDYVLQRTR